MLDDSSRVLSINFMITATYLIILQKFNFCKQTARRRMCKQYIMLAQRPRPGECRLTSYFSSTFCYYTIFGSSNFPNYLHLQTL
uniref:Uncharacterized protein n=1 Tax=Glossina pallidipes TaxID=7398 RepID=A0A1A9ZCK5_GLOPL